MSLFWFFVFFEFVLFPVSVLMLFGKSGERFLRVLFFLGFTFFFSVPFFLVLLKVFFSGGFSSWWWGGGFYSLLFFLVYFVFSVKFPVFFFHS